MNGSISSRDSIQGKLTRIIMLTSGTAILLACISFITFELFSFRRNLISGVTALAKVVAANSTGAIAFENIVDAKEVLASLKTRPDVVEAALYKSDGTLFASYVSDQGGQFPISPGSDGSQFVKGELIFFEPVIQSDTRLGTLYIKVELSSLYDQFHLYGIIVIIVLFCSISFAFILSRRLQAKISMPILELARSAKVVSDQNDYSIRARKLSNDELGDLTDTFNQMLNRIHQMNSELERRVKERTNQLEGANKELARSNSELEQFAYVASHDLQEPLRMMAGFSALLADEYKGKLSTDADEYLTLIIDGAKRMHSLVNDLLEFSRVGRVAANFTQVNLEKVVDSVLSRDLKGAIMEVGAEVSRDPLPVITADSIQMTQLFLNLIGNAIKFHGAKSPRIHISAKEEDSFWQFSVRDNGIGIKPEYSEKIFLIFQRLHDRKEYPGTGIGLAICKKIVEQHKGKIWVSSTLGEGATFHFTIAKNLKNEAV